MRLTKQLGLFLLVLLSLHACGDKEILTPEPRELDVQNNCFYLSPYDTLASTFTRLNHYGSLGDAKSDIDICIYGGLTREDFFYNRSVAYPIGMIYLDCIADSLWEDGAGIYQMDSSGTAGTIQYASILYSPQGISDTIKPQEQLVTSGTLFVSQEEGVYRFFFRGTTDSGAEIVIEQWGKPFIDE